jgi:hypothetical protein
MISKIMKNNPPPFKDAKVSILCSQESVASLYPEPDESSQHPHALF